MDSRCFLSGFVYASHNQQHSDSNNNSVPVHELIGLKISVRKKLMFSKPSCPEAIKRLKKKYITYKDPRKTSALTMDTAKPSGRKR